MSDSPEKTCPLIIFLLEWGRLGHFYLLNFLFATGFARRVVFFSKSREASQLDNSLDPPGVERFDYRSTPLSSRSSLKNPHNTTQSNSENDGSFCYNCSSDAVTSNGLGTPKVTKLETPSL